MTASSSAATAYDTIDPAVLSQVVRLDQNSPDYVLADWTVRTLSVKDWPIAKVYSWSAVLEKTVGDKAPGKSCSKNPP